MDRKNARTVDFLGNPVPSPIIEGRSDWSGVALALAQGDPARVAAQVKAAWELPQQRDSIVEGLLLWLADRPAGLLDPVLGSLAAAVRIAQDDPQQAVEPIIIASLLLIDHLGARPVLAPLAPAELPFSAASLAAAVAQGDGSAAEAWVGRALADGVDPLTIQKQLLALACRYPGDGAVAALAVQRVGAIRTALGPARAVAVLPRLARAIADRPEELPCTQAHEQRLAAIGDSLSSVAKTSSPEKAKVFQEVKFRPHILDGAGDTALRATWKALAFGIPPELIADSLALAAAERVLRTEVAVANEASAVEGWPDALHLLCLADVVRQILALVPAQDALPLLLYAVAWTHAHGALDAPVARRWLLPAAEAIHQTWDHGPEIAKIIALWHKGQAVQAVAHLRGYFLMVLPDQPLTRQLRVAAFVDAQGRAAHAALAIAAVTAAVDSFHALAQHPHHENPLCAVLFALCSWQNPASRSRLAQATWSRAGRPQVRRVGAGPGL